LNPDMNMVEGAIWKIGLLKSRYTLSKWRVVDVLEDVGAIAEFGTLTVDASYGKYNMQDGMNWTFY
jgi:hypothetical protein